MEKRTSAARGQTIVEATGRDDSSHKVKNDYTGNKMGGSSSDLSATISGGSAVQTSSGKKGSLD